MIRAQLPMTLSRYLGRQFIFSALLVLGVMAGLIIITDMVEFLRRASGQPEIGLGKILGLTLLKLPYMLQRVLPFAALIGAILALSRLTRTQELIVSRAAGVSVWQFLSPALIIAVGTGILTLLVLNPLAAVMLSRYEQLDAKYFKGRSSTLAVSETGLWLRQMDDSETGVGTGGAGTAETIIHALRVSPRDMVLGDVTLFFYAPDDRFLRRIDAQKATLHDGYWALEEAILTAPGEAATQHTQLRQPTRLTLGQIQDSFAYPETLSFWELARFIHVMEEAGFSALRHRLYWQSMLALPVMLAAMVLVGAIFSLKPHRMGGVGRLFAAGVVTGFLVFFITDIVNALALSGTLPVVIAAWSMPIVALVASIGMLLHLEDG
jgi:lipopolysaccharide export system permease protein